MSEKLQFMFAFLLTTFFEIAVYRYREIYLERAS